MLAALAASGYGPGSSSRTPAEELRQSASARGAALPPAESSAAAASSSASALTRRRSQRLSAKKGPSGTDNSTDPVVAADVGPADILAPDPPLPEIPTSHASVVATATTDAVPGETVVHDGGFAAEFSDDDEIDAEVFILSTCSIKF